LAVIIRFGALKVTLACLTILKWIIVTLGFLALMEGKWFGQMLLVLEGISGRVVQLSTNVETLGNVGRGGFAFWVIGAGVGVGAIEREAGRRSRAAGDGTCILRRLVARSRHDAHPMHGG
jgi:hypothetical protein